MRRVVAALIALLLSCPALAQVRGFIKSIGFENHYRSGCWTPMVVELEPLTPRAGFYHIRVQQQDLDRDRVVFTRRVSLTGAAEGRAARQDFRMHFVPQPVDGGLADAFDPGSTLADLQRQVRVSLHADDGEFIAELPLTSAIVDIDRRPAMPPASRGVRFVLAVTDGVRAAASKELPRVLGTLEDTLMVAVGVDALPEEAIGYEAVDAIVWLGPDPADLGRGGGQRRAALEAWVRGGGHLVVAHASPWQASLGWGDLLPVRVAGAETLQAPLPLGDWAAERHPDAEALRRAWASVAAPLSIGRAAPQDGALVEQWIVNAPGEAALPLLARRGVGGGAVTWVAIDLGDRALTRQDLPGWAGVWTRVLGLADEPFAAEQGVARELVESFAGTGEIDLGLNLIRGADLPGRSFALVAVAVGFFLVYWLIAGPGLHLYLVNRRRAELSWFAFAAAGVAATLLTVALVKLVLRGPAQAAHQTLVRAAPGAPARIVSRIGLYIPRDGEQEIAPGRPVESAALRALPIHPRHLLRSDARLGEIYMLPLPDAEAGVATWTIPFRSTLKKLQVDAVAPLDARVEGSARLATRGFIDGRLTNGTGAELRNVYIAFRYPLGPRLQDMMLYRGRWAAGETLDLAAEYNGQPGAPVPRASRSDNATPDRTSRVRGDIALDFSDVWYAPWRVSFPSPEMGDDFGREARASTPMLSFFDRLPPVRAAADLRRFDLARRGARHLNASAALLGGALVVVGESDDVALPVPLQVEGRLVAGRGTIVHQYVLPLDRSAVGQAPTGP